MGVGWQIGSGEIGCLADGRVADEKDGMGGRWERWGGWQMGEMSRVAGKRNGRWERWGGWQMGEMVRVADGRDGDTSSPVITS